MNELHSQEVLRKVKSQYMEKQRFTDDMWQDITVTKKSYDSTIKGKVLNGYIQMISRYPLIIHMYCEEQLFFLKLIEKSKLKLHLDATGSVVRKLDRDEKNFLYYALTLQHPIAKISPIPLAEMLTNEQTNVEITHFLNRWYYDVRRILNRDICPSQVEVDFSWALLHSICKIFNRQHLEDYLNTCWQYIQTSQTEKYWDKSILHICSAHLMNRISYKLEHTMKIKKSIKRIFMFLMARLVACTNIGEFEQLFTALCMVCLAKRIYPEIQQYISKIEKAIKSKEEDIDEDFDYIAELDEELTNDMGDSNSYKSKSPFGRYFNGVLIKCQERIYHLEIMHKTTSLVENDNYFLPRLPTFLATHYIPICPLWTSLILGPVMAPNESDVRSSNAIVENWMRILKINILQNQTKLRPGDFLRKIREGLEGRIRAFGFAFEPLSSKILKTKVPRKIKDNKLAEEIWQRRKKNKTTYFMTTNSQMTSLLTQNITNSEKHGSKSTKKAEILKRVGKTGNKRNPIIEKQTKSIILKDQSSLKKMLPQHLLS